MPQPIHALSAAYAIEHLDKEQRDHYLNMKKAAEAGQNQEGDRS